MLSINRYAGEKIILSLPTGSIVTVMVGKRKGNQIQLLITAPNDVVVSRPDKEQDQADQEAYRNHLLMGKSEKYVENS